MVGGFAGFHDNIRQSEGKNWGWFESIFWLDHQKLGYAKISGAPTGGDEVLNAIISRSLDQELESSESRD